MLDFSISFLFVFLMFQRLKILSCSLDLNYSIKIKNLATWSWRSTLFTRSIVFSSSLEWLNKVFLHCIRVPIFSLNLFLRVYNPACSVLSSLFCSTEMSISWLIVIWWSMLIGLSTTGFFGWSYRKKVLPFMHLLAISSFLYLLMRLNLRTSSSDSSSNIPELWSHAQNIYLTMFGTDKSIILLNKLFMRFVLSTPYDPLRKRSWVIMLLSSSWH